MSQSLPEIEVSQISADSVRPTHILDVREQDEWDAGHIEGALHIPMGDVPNRLAELPTEPVYVVCRAGGRSARVVGFLQGQGVDAVNVTGGMQAWSSAGYSMVGTADQPAHVI